MSLKRKIFNLTFFIATIPILIISIITFFIFSGEMKKIQSQKMDLISQNIEGSIQNEINSVGETLEHVADTYNEEHEGLTSLNFQVDNKYRLKHMFYHMQDMAEKKKSIKFIAFGSSDKQMIFDNLTEDQNLSSDFDPTTRPWYIGALNSKGNYLSKVFIHAGTGNPIVTLSKKIELDGEIMGVLVAMIDLSHIENKISKFKIENTGSFFIVDRNNKILVDGGDNKKIFDYISKMDLFSRDHFKIIKKTPMGKKLYHIKKIKDLDIILIGSVDEKNELSFINSAIKKMNYEVIKRENNLKYISETDPLTGCYNRRAIIDLIEKEIEQSKNFNLNFSLIMFDLDKFKKINDTFGHLFGDTVLKDISKAISSNIKTTDIFGRYGGEEFLILLPNTKLREGVIIAERLRMTIEKMTWKYDTVITVSMGVVKNLPNDTLDLVLGRVDNLLYRAKKNGRNRVEY